MARQLRRPARLVLLTGRHAHIGGRTLAKRASNITAIAAAYTREELLSERGVGSITLDEIEQWLLMRGLQLRGGTSIA